MKLLLCSYAPHKTEELEKAFLDLLTKPIDENKVFILSIDTTSQFHLERLEIVKQGYLRLGILEINITIYNLISDTIPNFDDLDVLHVWGGNTFHYLKQIREKGLVPKIHDFIDRGGVYVGSSAGSMIMGPSVDEDLYIKEKNEVGLQDTTGFGIVSFYICPHGDSKSDEVREEMLKYGKASGKYLIPLTDQQGVLVHDNGYEII